MLKKIPISFLGIVFIFITVNELSSSLMVTNDEKKQTLNKKIKKNVITEDKIIKNEMLNGIIYTDLNNFKIWIGNKSFTNRDLGKKILNNYILKNVFQKNISLVSIKNNKEINLFVGDHIIN